MREERRSRRRLAAFAGRQYGVVTRSQLLRLGFSGSAVGRMARAGELQRVHRGVYAVGHRALSRHGRCLAAVAACGRGARLSHGSAAWLWGLVGSLARPIEVTVPAHGRRRDGIDVHHAPSASIEAAETFENVPVTSVARTLLDLAATGRSRRLRTAIEGAERRGLLDLIEIDAILARRAGSPGSRRLAEALSIYRAPVFSRSWPERAFRDLAAKAALPPPACNVFVAGYEVDAYWERERFAVEVDGWQAHRSREAFERDPVRQEDLKLAGIDSIRVTARRIEREPVAVGRRLGRLLAARRRDLGLDP
jgi:predicted transcriptional regulator of viral defense system